MRVAFRKRSSAFYSRLIRLWTLGPYSHVELVFSDGLAFSSDEADGGTRYKPVKFTRGEWDFIPVPVLPAVEARLRIACNKELGCKYDWRGIAFSFLPVPIGWQHPERWFCSEICTAILQQAGYLVGHTPSALSPNAMYKALKKEVRSC